MNIEQNEHLPELNSLLASMIRLVSNYVHCPNESQAFTLLHIIEKITLHPDYEQSQAVKVAVEHSKTIWLEQVKSFPCSVSCNCPSKSDKNQLH